MWIKCDPRVIDCHVDAKDLLGAGWWKGFTLLHAEAQDPHQAGDLFEPAGDDAPMKSST